MVHGAIAFMLGYYVLERPFEDRPVEEKGWISIVCDILIIVSALPMLHSAVLSWWRALWVLDNPPG
jgi:hypothetical protein